MKTFKHNHFYRLQRKFAKVMISQVSVCLSVHKGGGEGCLPHIRTLWADTPHADTPLGRHPPGQTPLARHPPAWCILGYTPSAQYMLGYGHKWAVRIPLECILVTYFYLHFKQRCPFQYGNQHGQNLNRN